MKHTKKLLVLAAAVAGAVGIATAGWAYWSASGSGSASATVGTLAAPVLSPPSSSGSTVSLSWTAVTPPGTGSVTYSVIRGDGSLHGTCGSSSITGTTCNDTSVPDGPHDYTVVAKFQSWTATSNLQSVTVVGGATVTGVSSTSANGTYGIGASIPIIVTFSAPVTVTGTPQLTLSTISPTTTVVNYTGGSGTNTLTFTYTVAAGNNTTDLNYDSTAALALNGGTIKNAVGGTDAILALPAPAAAESLGSNKDIVIDGVAPTVTNVSSTTADGSYKAGTVIPVTVAFNDTVTVTGTPQLTLSTGTPATTAVNYTGGSGTNTLTFTYTVAAGNTAADLDYVATTSLALNGGTVKDATGNDAARTLAAPGTAGSLGANKNLVIDTTAPTIVSSSPVTASPTNGPSVQWTVTYSESVTGVDSTDFSLTKTGLGGTPAVTGVTTVSGSVYRVTASTGTSDGTLQLSVLNDGTVKDQATNPLSGATFPGATYTIDRTAPTVTVTAPSSQTNAQPLAYSVVFSEPVTDLAAAGVTVTAPAADTGLAKNVSKTDNQHFTISVSGLKPDGTGDGTITVTVNAGAVNDQAGNANTASNTASTTWDTTAPTVTIAKASGQADPTKTSPINFTVSFGESVSGFSSSGVTIGGTTGGTKAVNVTGSGTTYNVAVSGMTDGTLTASVKANAIQDAAGNGNTASGTASVTYDTTGPTASAISTTSGSIAGKPEVSDSVTFTFSELVAPSTVYSGWSGSSQPDVTNAKITFNDSPSGNGTNQNNDSFTVSGPAGTTLNLGTVNGIEGHLVPTNGGSYSFTATLHYAESSGKSVVTVTLTSLNSGGTTVGTATANGYTWNPVSAVTDLAGNTMATTSKSVTTSLPF